LVRILGTALRDVGGGAILDHVAYVNREKALAPRASHADPSLTVATELPAVGNALRLARESRGLSLADVAAATNVQERFLEALEKDDSVEVFPAPAYARFFLREYARVVGLDDGPLLEAFDLRERTEELTIEAPPPPVVPPPTRWAGRVLAGAALCALVFLVVLPFWRHHPPHPVATARGPVPATASPLPSPRASTEAAKPKGMEAVLVFSDRCWISATVDGKVVVQQTYVAGDSVTVRARRSLTLRLGNAAAAYLRINGKHYPIAGSVVTVSFAWQRGRVLPT
jgi:hypothetical protein